MVIDWSGLLSGVRVTHVLSEGPGLGLGLAAGARMCCEGVSGLQIGEYDLQIG